MKVHKLLLYFLAAGALLVGCKEEEEEPALPVLNVGQTELSFEQGGGTATVTVTSNRPWSISSDADWLAFNPSNGTASDAPVNVTVTALSNSSTDRSSSFKVKTDFDYKTVNVTQKGQKGEDPNKTATGSGTANDPYNVYAAIQKANTLVAYNSGDLTSENSATVYTKGKVVNVEIDPSYGNATYYISADGTSETQLEVYRGKYLGGANFLTKDQLKVGDEVVVYGSIVNFKGNTPEYTTGSKIISINGSSEAPAIDFTKFELITVKSFIEKANNAQFFRLKGTVSKFNKQYCSFDLTDESGTIYVYSVNNKDEWSEKLSNGGTVELAGLYTFYEKNNQHEVVSAQILSFEPGSGGGDHSDAVAKTVADFISTADKATYFKLTGTVSKFNAQYCSFDLTDESGTIYVYSVDNKDEWSSKISNGGTVTLAGKYAFYEKNNQHEVVNAQILSFEAASGEDHGDAVAKTVDEFIKAADTENFYKLTGSVTGFNKQYCSFDLTDATGKIYVYSVANKADWSDKISNGGTVTLAGKYAYYEAKEQPEVIEAQILSFTAGETPDAETATVAQAIAAEKDAVLKVGPATVVAAASAGFLMEQDGAKIYVYGGKAKVGDNVTVTATRAEYQGTPQLSNPDVTVNSKGATVTYPDAKDINSQFGSYTSDNREFVTFKGKLNISGNYYNITVDGSSSVTGSIVKPVEDIASLNGKDVTVKGYYLYHTSQGKYLYVIATDINGTAITGGDGGSGGGGGETVSGNTIVFADLNIENGKQYNGSGDDKTVVKGTDYTVSFGKGSNDGKYYNTGSGIRTYGDGYIKVTSAKTITKIVYTFQKATANEKPTYPVTGEYTVSTGSLALSESVATWTGSSSEVKLTRPTGTGHWRLQKVEVTFAE